MNKKESYDESLYISVVCYCFSLPLSNKKTRIRIPRKFSQTEKREIKYPLKISKTENRKIKYPQKVTILQSRN